MKIKPRVKQNNEKGFTMVEILAVITLIGFLMVLIVPSIVDNVKKAKINSTKSQIKAAENIIVQYYMDCGNYPSTQEGLKALIQKPSTAPEGWSGPYVNANQKFIDAFNKDLRYICPGQHNPDSYDIYSLGPDGKEGGNDDIGNWQ